MGKSTAYNNHSSYSEHHVNKTCMDFKDIIIAFIIIVLIILAFFGNVGVVLAVIIYRRMRTFTNMLLVSLATADLLVGALVMPPALIYLLLVRWPFGSFLCKMWATIDVWLCTASILNLCVISLDRFFAINWPLKYIRKRTKRLAASLLVSVWILSFVICAPPWFIPGWGFKDDPSECGYVITLPYRIYSACGSFYAPLVIMLFVYCRILRVANTREQSMCPPLNSYHNKDDELCYSYHWKKSPVIRGNSRSSRQASNRLTVSEPPLSTTIYSTMPKHYSEFTNYGTQTAAAAQHELTVGRDEAEPETFSGMQHDPELDSETIVSKRTVQIGTPTLPTLTATARRAYSSSQPNSLLNRAMKYYVHSKPIQNRRVKNLYLRERKALKTIGIIVIGFITCWFPFFIIYILESACERCVIWPQLEATFLWLGYSNSVLNPLIYTLYNADFRRCFKDMITCGCMKQRVNRRQSVRRLQSRL